MELRWLKRVREGWVQNNPDGQIPGPPPVWGVVHEEPVLQYKDEDGVWKTVPMVTEEC